MFDLKYFLLFIMTTNYKINIKYFDFKFKYKFNYHLYNKYLMCVKLIFFFFLNLKLLISK